MVRVTNGTIKKFLPKLAVEIVKLYCELHILLKISSLQHIRTTVALTIKPDGEEIPKMPNCNFDNSKSE